MIRVVAGRGHDGRPRLFRWVDGEERALTDMEWVEVLESIGAPMGTLLECKFSVFDEAPAAGAKEQRA